MELSPLRNNVNSDIENLYDLVYGLDWLLKEMGY